MGKGVSMDRRLLKNIDYALLTAVGLLVAVGLLMVYSATFDRVSMTGSDPFFFVKKQLIAVAIGTVGLVLMLFFDYRLPDGVGKILYVINIVLLILVLLVGSERNGSKSWLWGIQPAEFSKIIMVVLFGKYLSERESLKSFYDFIGPFLFMVPSLLLIMLQPDLGTSLVFIFFTFIMMYIAGAPGKKLLTLILIAVLGVTGLFVSHKYFDTPLPVKQYQINRLTSFINPEKDAQGSGWNVIQAIIAVGSGRFSGKGWLQGTQGRLGYLPENHTDFIFAILCEELGFVGGFVVLLLFFILIWRGLRIAYQARDKAGNIIASGILSVFFFHVVENVGMNIGLMPITGIPLPFISSGGSSMISSLISVGVLLNIWMRHSKIMF